MSESLGLSIRAFALEIGKSDNWVARRVRDGRIPRNDDKSIPLEEGKKAVALLLKQDEAKKKKTAVKKMMKSELIAEDLPDDDEPGESDDVKIAMTAAEVVKAFNEARMEEKRAQAELKKLELEIKRGDFVSVAEVKADATAVAAVVRERVLSMPSRFAGLCEGRPQREIEAVLEDAARDILAVFEKSKFVEQES